MRLINTTRLRESTVPNAMTLKQSVESDRGRVLFSAPFRRLQSKAQVFSLESNAAVRSRLTHSLEVAHIGKYIVQKVYEKFKNNPDDTSLDEYLHLETVVETACLLHDIGNPPFGHLGEAAIQQWFSKKSQNMYKKSMNGEGDDLCENSGHYKDFVSFDGNPQGIRICITLQGQAGKCGFNLTYGQIGALLKYPKSSLDDFDYKKIGVFQTELEAVKKVWEGTGINWGERNKLLYLMEAADDIAYSLSDIEDGIEKKIIDEICILKEISKEFQNKSLTKYIDIVRQSLECTGLVTLPFVSFRTKMINSLTECAANIFYENISNNNSFSNSLFEGTDEYEAIKVINNICKEKLYSSPEAEDIEIAGYNIICGILDKFSILLEMSKDDFSRLINHKGGNALCVRMFSKIPNGLIRHYEYALESDEENEWYHRVRLVVDYICGMTDDFALKVYRLLHGISVETI